MQFVYPYFLWALSAISAPVIIHLFHFRRYKKIVFSDIRFLKQLQEQNKSKQKLKDWLILLCRICLLACLVLAFAQPFIPVGENSKVAGHKNVSIFVDNSFSMNAEGSEGPLLEMAKNKARAVVNAYDNNDRFQILTNGLGGSEQRLTGKTEALAKIDAIAPAAASATARDISTRQRTTFQLENSRNNVAYFISDFQKSQFNLATLDTDSSIRYSFVPVTNNTGQNISIDSIFLANPFIKTNDPLLFNIQLTNHGKETAEGVVVTISMNGVQKALLNVTIGAGETTTAEARVTLTAQGWHKGEVSITDYPVTYDDKLFFSLKPSSRNNILAISNLPNRYIGSVFADDPNYGLTWNTYGNINYQSFSSYQLIIVNEPEAISSGLGNELTKYLQQGGQVLIVLPPTGAANLNAFCAMQGLPLIGNNINQPLRVSAINTRSLLFKGGFKNISAQTELPAVKQVYQLQKQSTTKGTELLGLNNGDPLLWQTSQKKGNIMLLALPLDKNFSTLPEHSLFVPMMLNMSMGTSRSSRLYYTINQDRQVLLPAETNSQVKLISMKNEKQELVTEITEYNGQKELQADAVNHAGWFDITGKGQGQLLSVAAFNNNRQESSMMFLQASEIEEQAGKLVQVDVNTSEASVLGAQISEELTGKKLWRWFILAALFFVLAEIALLRLMR